MAETSPSNAGSTGSIPGQGGKISHASWPKNQNIKQKQYCSKFNENFKNGPHQKKKKKKKTLKKAAILSIPPDKKTFSVNSKFKVPDFKNKLF